MTCATCGAVGATGTTWCAQCYMPYVRAGGDAMPYVPAGEDPPPLATGLPSRSGMPWQTPTPPVIPPPPAFPPGAAFVPNAFPADAFAGNAFAGPLAYEPQAQVLSGYPPPGFAQQQHQYPPQEWPAKLGLVVPQYAVETGDLPRICVVSGRPTDNFVKMRWAWAPRWSWFLGLLIRLLISDRVAGYLPIDPKVRRQMRLLPVLAVFGILAGVLTMAFGFGAGQLALGVAGVVVTIGSVVVISVQSSRLPVRRAAPGYVAFPKASPEFVAAFRAGRPSDQRPFSAVPAKYHVPLLAKVGIVFIAVVAGLGVVVNFRDQSRCSLASVHPNVDQVDAAFAQSRSEIGAINATSGGRPLTREQGEQLVASHTRLIATVGMIALTPSDRAALDRDEAVISTYDQALLAYQRTGTAQARQAFAQARTAMDAAGPSVSAAMHAQPADCTTS